MTPEDWRLYTKGNVFRLTMAHFLKFILSTSFVIGQIICRSVCVWSLTIILGPSFTSLLKIHFCRGFFLFEGFHNQVSSIKCANFKLFNSE